MMHGGRGHNILLVDDEEIFLFSLFDGLRRRFPEMTFRTAHDGEAALATIHQHPVELVITDLKMPKMDGFQLIAAMHSQYPAIPLLIMTAHSTEISEGRAMASGALHCIDKPVDLAELSRRIDELFSTGAIASLRGVSLAAFLQLLALERKSGIVDVQSEGVRARLYLSGGQIIHADNGDLTGLPAALRTVCLEHVEIHFRPGAVPKTPTIDLPLTQLLLDAARQRDEKVRDATSDFDELAFSESFSESFSDAFDEQLGKLEKVTAPVEGAPAPLPRSPAILPGIAPMAARRTTTLPIPRPPSPLSASARASVLTPPSGRPALPRPPGLRPRSSTLPGAAHSAGANVSDAVASCLRKIGEISGVLGAAFIDFHSGETLGAITRDAGFETVASARANLEMLRAKVAMISSLGLIDTIEDIVITTRHQYYVLRMSARLSRQFVFVALSRDHATLALARFLVDEALRGAGTGAAES
jgi:CheY-like chemotaxis protein